MCVCMAATVLLDLDTTSAEMQYVFLTASGRASPRSRLHCQVWILAAAPERPGGRETGRRELSFACAQALCCHEQKECHALLLRSPVTQLLSFIVHLRTSLSTHLLPPRVRALSELSFTKKGSSHTRARDQTVEQPARPTSRASVQIPLLISAHTPRQWTPPSLPTLNESVFRPCLTSWQQTPKRLVDDFV